MTHRALVSAATAHRVRREEIEQLAEQKAAALAQAQQDAQVEGFPAPTAPTDQKEV